MARPLVIKDRMGRWTEEGVQEINVICRALKNNFQACFPMEQNCPLGDYNIIM